MPPTGDSLTLTVPAGWQVVDLDGLLSHAVAEALIEALDDEIEPPEREALRAGFDDLHEQVEADRIVFMALRVDGQSRAQEVVTLALPGDVGPRGVPTASVPGAAATTESAATGAGSSPDSFVGEAGQSHEAIRLCERSAIAHLSAPDAEGGSWAQLVFFLPGTREGAILTLISSGSGCAEALKKDATAIAGSLGVGADGAGEG
jgi:hypothetical protein